MEQKILMLSTPGNIYSTQQFVKGGNSHEMSNPVFFLGGGGGGGGGGGRGGRKKNIINFLSAEFAQRVVKANIVKLNIKFRKLYKKKKTKKT